MYYNISYHQVSLVYKQYNIVLLYNIKAYNLQISLLTCLHSENKRKIVGWKKLQIKIHLLRLHKKLRIFGRFLRQPTQKHMHFHVVYTCLVSIGCILSTKELSTYV